MEADMERRKRLELADIRVYDASSTDNLPPVVFTDFPDFNIKIVRVFLGKDRGYYVHVKNYGNMLVHLELHRYEKYKASFGPDIVTVPPKSERIAGMKKSEEIEYLILDERDACPAINN
jgi:hypothetical protein